MTALWTAPEAAAATGGRATTDWRANGVSIDTRTLQPGDLFVALKDLRDGHDFVAQALEKGAAAALVSRIPEGVAPDAPLLIVDDVLPALERLGIAARARSAARVIAVTGSAGKTSTKEMLRAVLAGQGRTHAAEASYNNHWGVPLTLARMPTDTEFAVIEIGMNHPGEIAPLTCLARPHVAIITTVVAAHLEAFGALEGIAHEKAAILEGLTPDGVAVLNGDLAVSDILMSKAAALNARVLQFGAGEGADIRMIRADLQGDTTVVVTRAGDTALEFTLTTAGKHFAMNALAVIGAAQALSLPLNEIARDLSLWLPPAGRGAREVVALPGGGFELIDDAFNANPASMQAALEVLASATPDGRRVAVLGDMLELGEDEIAMHRALADDPGLQAADLVHCVGSRMRALYDALPPAQRGEWVDTADDLATRAAALAGPGDVILVKGSKGSKVSRVVDALRKLGQAGAS
ncbi:UDP-N-acetylmuramoyl-tripeptide--D-alanyl-D-alanine ligase [Actibacterium sp. XHP0104]|uniref:UDP-N-acetylmuramoyl-tripeptide--D-alanyl-D- alanine ligase n=1 Tax=Actibacterium sp. XHP0104 TaxID=2984335 RepID=UPI0021E8DC5F|nr:UDP-N-acetylmuramoyl-tripeptide--D-alanyl-D-alanine ligase [Actibacterium sp. XHP0104]MCV2881323.1 UDP-N-acetylmuramoyl-tripeptide--D-alanyl-D-alanine ligase [Actibacterium sp. XHP0104]